MLPGGVSIAVAAIWDVQSSGRLPCACCTLITMITLAMIVTVRLSFPGLLTRYSTEFFWQYARAALPNHCFAAVARQPAGVC